MNSEPTAIEKADMETLQRKTQTSDLDLTVLRQHMTIKKSIIVVDDEELYLKALSKLLTKCGYELSTARDGEEGLRTFKKGRFDLIITDLLMPKMNGIELLKRIKSISPETKALIITGCRDTELYLESMALGVVKYIPKPINFPELRKTIRKIFANQKSKLAGYGLTCTL